jgi:cytochrome P450
MSSITSPRTGLAPDSGAAATDAAAAAVFDPDTFTSGAPFDALALLRAESPVHPVRLPELPLMWLVTRHEDVVRLSRDDATFSSASGNTLIPATTGPNSAMIPGLDPPRHTHFRKLINQGFSPRNVRRLEQGVRETARRIVDGLVEKGEFDAVPDISAELSLQVIADVIGVPQEDRHELFRWSNAIGSLGIEDPDYAPTPDSLALAGAAMFNYCGELVARRRQEEPRDDILAALMVAEVEGVRLTTNQLNEFFLLLAIAGNETTRNTMSHGILALSEHPEQRAQIAADSTAVPGAVDEMLRWATPVLHFRRTATKDIELRGQHVKAGDWVVMHYLSANRDEAAFPGADRFDISRGELGHTAFGGGGTHYCLGAQLAKLELRVMLEELYSRIPELTVTAAPTRLRSSFFHGIKSLPCSTEGAK